MQTVIKQAICVNMLQSLDNSLIEAMDKCCKKEPVFSAMKDLGNLSHPKPLFISSKIRKSSKLF